MWPLRVLPGSASAGVRAQAQFGGYTKNGGFAAFILADPNDVAHSPAGLAAHGAAPLTCAGITAETGLQESQARPGARGTALTPTA